MDKEKIIIIGGVAGGTTAATRFRRLNESAEIILFERGEEISFANCGIPYYIGGAIGRRRSLLLQTPRGLAARYRIDARVRSEVVAIDAANKRVKVYELDTGEEYFETYDKLVLSPGARPIRLPFIPNDERVFTVRSLGDADGILKAVSSGARRALVIGGGFVGIELAENLREAGLDVVLLEAAPQIAGFVDAEFAAEIETSLERNGVKVYTSMKAERFEEGETECVLHTAMGAITADIIVQCAGVRPETELAESAGLSIGARGGIYTDTRMRTSDPDIYALGDAAEIKRLNMDAFGLIPLAGPANRQARVVGGNLAGLDARYEGSLGTSIVKAFDVTVAATGLGEREARLSGRAYKKVYVYGQSHAGYYPNADELCIKLLFEEGGKLLGAQISGRSGVSKRVDVLATAISLGARVQDLVKLDLSYAPPFGSAKDPVHVAGAVASNVVDGIVRVFHWDELNDLPNDALLLDVRTEAEYASGALGGAVNIPVDELRERLNELPKDRPIYLYCAMGLRGYIAYRILAGNGFDDLNNLSGGMKIVRQAGALNVK